MSLATAARASVVDTARSSLVLDATELFIRAQAQSPRQAALLLTALGGLREQVADAQAVQPFIDLPFGICAAVRDAHADALPLAVITSLLFLGIDILDDLADGDGPSHWTRYRPAEVNLAACTLLAALPQRAIAQLPVDVATRDRMQRTLAEGLLRMGAGQQDDLAHAGRSYVTADAVERSVIGKSGEEIATMAALAALFAGADPKGVAAYTDMGRALGTAGQLATDCYDLFQSSHSRDLANGTRTLPIALYLEQTVGAAREEFLRELDAAKTDAVVQERLRQRLRAWGGVRRSAFIVEIHCQRALQALATARPAQPGAAGLRALIRQVSFFGEGR